MEDYISSSELLDILTNQCDIRNQEYVEEELKKNKDILLKSLSYYRKPNNTSKEKLEQETKVKQLQRNFTLKLSKFIDLDELQSLKLFYSYLQNSFRESKEQLQEILQHEILMETLLIKVMEYYFEERNSILKCLEVIIIQSQNSSHPYQEIFVQFLDDIMKDMEIFTEMWHVYQTSCQTPIHLPMVDHLDMVKRHSHRFARQLLSEQIGVLRLLYLLYKHFDNTSKSLLSIVALFQSQVFGTRQLNRHSFDGYTKLMIPQIGFLQVMILLEGMKLHTLINHVEEQCLEDHVIGKIKDTKQLEKIILKWGDLVHHSPVMLAWAAVRFTVMDDDVDTPNIVQMLGSRALQCGVFPYLFNLIRSSPFSDDEILSNSSRSTVYDLLSIVLTLFHETTLGDPVMIIAVLKETLRNSELCEKFWNSSLNCGMAMLLKSATEKFPYNFSPFAQIMASLAMDENSSENVFHYLHNMKSYTELLSLNSLEDVDCVDSDKTSWKLINAKILYKSVVSTADKIVIPMGTFGKVTTSNEGAHLLQWSLKYSCWQLFLLELDYFLQYVPHSSDRERHEMVKKVLDVIEILHNVLLYNWSKIISLVSLIDRVYYIVQKFSANPNCPLELLVSCLKCLVIVTSYETVQSWLSFQQTGFLPFCVTSLQPSDGKILMSSVTIDPGHFGHVLPRERSRGHYPVTLATLDIIKEFLPGMSCAEATNGSKINDFVACIVFVCREIFTGYQKWFYNNLKEKQEIGLKCLEIFHGILCLKENDEDEKTFDTSFDSSFTNVTQSKSKTHVSRVARMLIEGMLWSDVGQTLIKIVGIGIEVVDKVSLLPQSSAGVVLNLVKFSLMVVNEVLDRRPKTYRCDEVDISPLENSLITQVTRKFNGDSSDVVHLIGTVASYLYIKEDNDIPVLAMKLLRKISFLSPMSMLCNLGSQTKSLRDAIINKLTSYTEDTMLKVAILDFLSAVVSTQPGLLEIFFDFSSSSIIVNEFGSNSCLKSLLTNLNHKNPAPVVAASYSFLYSLWRNRRHVAMTTVKKSEKFWTTLSQYLMEDLDDSDKMLISHIQIRSYVLQIIAHELFYIKSDELDAELKKVLEIFEAKRRYEYMMYQYSNSPWLLCNVVERKEMIEACLNFQKSWRTFLMVVTEFSSVLLNDKNAQMMILMDITRSIRNHLEEEIDETTMKMIVEKCSCFLMLLRKWIKAAQSSLDLIESIVATITTAEKTDSKIVTHLRVSLFSSLSLLLQNTKIEDREETSEYLLLLLPLMCEMLQYRNEPNEEKQCHQQTRCFSVSLSLLNEIVTFVKEPVKWHQVFTEHALYDNIVNIFDVNLKKMENVEVIDSAIHFILSLANYLQTSQSLCLNKLVQPLCLGMFSLLKKIDCENLSQSDKCFESRDKWLKIWCCSLVVMATLLRKLRYQFLKECLDFVAVHCCRIVKVMDMVGDELKSLCLKEVEYITVFIIELSEYRKEWQLTLPQAFQQIIHSSSCLLHNCIAVLIRPRLLAYVIEKPRDFSKLSDPSSVSKRKLSQSLSTTRDLLRPFSTPDEPLEKQNPVVVETQKTLLRIVCNVMAFQRNFTPNICELLLDEGMDIDEYTPLFTLTFSAPALDNERSPGFGTLLSCLNVCLGYMQEADPRPLSSPDRSPWKFQALSSSLAKSSVNFAMDNSIILILSQALLYLKDPRVEHANKQLLKRKLGSELEPFLRGVLRHFGRRGYSPSPGSTPKSVRSTSRSLNRSRSEHWEGGDEKEVKLFKLVEVFLKTFI